MTIRIANAAGFWGDDLDAPRRLLASADVDYLTLEYLSELTMSILAHQRAKNHRTGFATDLLTVLEDVIPKLRTQPQLRVVTNAGGVNPRGCAQAVARKLSEAGFDQESIGVVSGDDLLPRLVELRAAGCDFKNLETGEPLASVLVTPACAHAYLGARPIVEALSDGARIVITGRVADASLTLGPVMHEYGWPWDDWQRLGAATLAGHLIECGAQVTGGYSARWRDIDLVEIGYPIAEVAPDGSAVITKPMGSGGIVDRQSVIEQLVYEIGDPAAYITPDVVADFTSAVVSEIARDRVLVQGASGKPATDTYKVSLAYPSGFSCSAILLVYGEDAESKARYVGRLVLERLQRRGIVFARTNVECLGAGDGLPLQTGGTHRAERVTPLTREVVLRITVQDPRRAAVERFATEIAPLITNGPNGLAGYAAGRPLIRPALAYWPTLVPKALVSPTVETQSVAAWCKESSRHASP